MARLRLRVRASGAHLEVGVDSFIVAIMSKLTERFVPGLRKAGQAPATDAKALRAALEKAQTDAVATGELVSKGLAAGADARRRAEMVSEAAASKANQGANDEGMAREIGGPKGLEPTRYGDWEKAGRCIDF